MTVYDKANQAWLDLDFKTLERLGVIDRRTALKAKRMTEVEAQRDGYADLRPENQPKIDSLTREHSSLWFDVSKAVTKALERLKKEPRTAEDLLEHLRVASGLFDDAFDDFDQTPDPRQDARLEVEQKVGGLPEALSAHRLVKPNIEAPRDKTATRLDDLDDLALDILDAIDKAEENPRLVSALTTNLMQVGLYIGQEWSFDNELTDDRNAWGKVYVEAKKLRSEDDSPLRYETLRDAVLNLGQARWTDKAWTDKGLARNLQGLLAVL